MPEPVIDAALEDPLGLGHVMIACADASLDFDLLKPNNANLEYLVRLDTTDPDVHLTREKGKPYVLAVLNFPVLDSDQELLRGLDSARRDLCAAKVLRGFAQLGIQWKLEETKGVWTNVQILCRIYAEHVSPGQVWERVERVVDAGFIVRAAILELRAENGLRPEPAPYPRRRVEVLEGMPEYVVVHTSPGAARWIHETAIAWSSSTEAVVDRLVAQARKDKLQPD